jgi:hypothetical protein
MEFKEMRGCGGGMEYKLDLGEVGWGGVDWIGLAQDMNRWRAVMNSVLNLRVPLNGGKI